MNKEKRAENTTWKRAGLFFLLFYLLPYHFSFAYDFGLILDQTVGAAGNGGESAVDYSGIFVPRFTFYWGEDADIYVSAGIRADYLSKEWTVAPELLRTELSMYFGKGALTAGRMLYSDPLGYVTDGLFDGARFSYDTNPGTFGAGAWYTGFLYKDRAYIAMTPKEGESYNKKLGYSDFANTYFAPRRFVTALDWENLSLAYLFMAKAALLGQFDLTGEQLNSQYFVGNITMPYKAFSFNLGACLELIQDSGDSGLAFSGDLGASWQLPTALLQRFLFLARYASGAGGGSSGSINAFLPVTSKTQGYVLKANLPGFTLLSLDYAAKLHPLFSIALSSNYFIRNDKETYSGLGDKGNLLGNEFYGRAFWSPLSDMAFNFGAGVFLPSMGNVAPDARALWRVEMNAVVSLY